MVGVAYVHQGKSQRLQSDLESLQHQEEKWLLKFNISNVMSQRSPALKFTK